MMVANIHGGGWSAKGFPDLVTCMGGRFVAFELKVGDNDLQEDQKIWKRRVIRAGGVFASPYTLGEFQQVVEDVLDGTYSMF